MLFSYLQAHNCSDSNAQKNNHRGCNHNPSCCSNVHLRWFWGTDNRGKNYQVVTADSKSYNSVQSWPSGPMHKSDMAVPFLIYFRVMYTMVALQRNQSQIWTMLLCMFGLLPNPCCKYKVTMQIYCRPSHAQPSKGKYGGMQNQVTSSTKIGRVYKDKSPIFAPPLPENCVIDI